MLSLFIAAAGSSPFSSDVTGDGSPFPYVKMYTQASARRNLGLLVYLPT